MGEEWHGGLQGVMGRRVAIDPLKALREGFVYADEVEGENVAVSEVGILVGRKGL